MIWVLAALFGGCGARTVHLDETPSPGGTTVPPVGGGGGFNVDPAVPGASVVIADQDLVPGFLVDETRVYWHTSNKTRLGGAFVRSCQKANCASSVTTYDSKEPGGSMGGSYSSGVGFTRLAVDASNLYWASHVDSGFQAISSCPIGGCMGAPRLVRSVTDLSSMVVDGQYLYWTAPSDTAVLRCPLSGCAGAAEAVALNQSQPGEMAVNRTHVYWVANPGAANSAIVRAVKDGTGQPETIASDQNQAWALTLDAQFVYWTNRYSIGTISRCPLDGCSGSPTVLASNQDRPTAVAADGKEVFWINSGSNPATGVAISVTLLKCLAETCASTVEVLGSPFILLSATVQALALDATHVYWLSHGKSIAYDEYPQASVSRMMK